MGAFAQEHPQASHLYSALVSWSSRKGPQSPLIDLCINQTHIILAQLVNQELKCVLVPFPDLKLSGVFRDHRHFTITNDHVCPWKLLDLVTLSQGGAGDPSLTGDAREFIENHLTSLAPPGESIDQGIAGQIDMPSGHHERPRCYDYCTSLKDVQFLFCHLRRWDKGWSCRSLRPRKWVVPSSNHYQRHQYDWYGEKTHRPRQSTFEDGTYGTRSHADPGANARRYCPPKLVHVLGKILILSSP